MKMLISAASILAGLVMASAASAGPMSAPSMERGGSAGLVQQVDYACGRGWYLGRDGYCHRHRPPPRWHRPPPGWGPPPHWHRPPPRPGWGPPGWGPPPHHWGPPRW